MTSTLFLADRLRWRCAYFHIHSVDFEDDIATLQAYSPINAGVRDNLFDMHRLVHFSTNTWLTAHGELTRWQERYVEILGEAFPSRHNVVKIWIFVRGSTHQMYLD
jgi:hypothetical protein